MSKVTNVMNDGSKWVVESRDQWTAAAVFPADFDRTGLSDITPHDATWRVYRRRSTGEIIDCAVFAKQMRAYIEDAESLKRQLRSAGYVP